MIKLNQNKIYFIYFSLYVSLLIGFFFNEDFAFGTIRDYLVHIDAAEFMLQDIVGTFLTYDYFDGSPIPHSPIYILYFSIIYNFFGDFFGRLIHMHFILLIPIFTFLSLKLKFNLENKDLIKLLPAIFFISPYFRSGALWIDDNVIGLTFLSISFYYYLRIENNENNELKLIFLNVFFLALAAYFRPIYCIFGIFFFLNFYSKFYFKKKFYYYILFNVVLSAPAFYYIVVLDINEWFQPWLFRTNNITTFSLALSLIFFYTIPFILSNLQKLKLSIYNKNLFIISIIYLIIIIFNFNYNLTYSGGFFFKVSNFLFSNNYLFYLSSFLSFYLIFCIFKNFKNKRNLFSDLILLVLLIFMEIDGVIYHETYDPLFYILSFLIFKNSIFKDTIKNLSAKTISYFFIFGFSFFILSVIKTNI